MEPGGGGSPDRPDCTMRVVRVSGRRGKQDSTRPLCLVPGCPGSRQGAVPVSTCLLCGGPWGHCREMERETEEGTGEEEANVGCFAESLPLGHRDHPSGDLWETGWSTRRRGPTRGTRELGCASSNPYQPPGHHAYVLRWFPSAQPLEEGSIRLSLCVDVWEEESSVLPPQDPC